MVASRRVTLGSDFSCTRIGVDRKKVMLLHREVMLRHRERDPADPVAQAHGVVPTAGAGDDQSQATSV